MNSPPSHATSIPASGDGSITIENVSIVRVLDYIRSTFSEESVLDALPLEAAANPGAYHAWRTYRAPVIQAHQQSKSDDAPTSFEQAVDAAALGRNRRPGEWNWEGVWEERVKKAVKASLSEPVLFGAEDIVRTNYRKASRIIFNMCRSDFETAMRTLLKG